MTKGEYEKMKADLSHSKVYSEKSVMEFVSKIAPGIRNIYTPFVMFFRIKSTHCQSRQRVLFILNLTDKS